MTPRTSPRRTGALQCLGAAILLACVGCGSGKEQKFAEVEGKVTLGGKPLAGVVVRFYPDTNDASQAPYSTGKTDALGHYELTSNTVAAGALVGRQRVVVSWPQPERPANFNDPPPRAPGPPIPVQYTVAHLTPLLVIVKAGQRQPIDLPLLHLNQ
jgi:hypothetical protein